jgi:hypothetical protein
MDNQKIVMDKIGYQNSAVKMRRISNGRIFPRPDAIKFPARTAKKIERVSVDGRRDGAGGLPDLSMNRGGRREKFRHAYMVKQMLHPRRAIALVRGFQRAGLIGD